MNVVIPKSLQQQVRKRAQKRGVTETAYIHTAIKQAIKEEDDLHAEMQMWEQASLQDFAKFVKKHKL